MSLLKLASLQSVANFCRSTDATSSFVVVLPFEPPTATSGSAKSSRYFEANWPSAFRVFSTAIIAQPLQPVGTRLRSTTTAHRPFLGGLPQKIVPVEPPARQSKEQVARLHLARIRAYALDDAFPANQLTVRRRKRWQ